MDWFDNPEFWELFYDWMFPESSFIEAESQVKKIKVMLGLESGAVLDLCCGPGRHSIPFSKAGFKVTAVDLQPLLLHKAKKRAGEQSQSIEFVESDMRDFYRESSFDLAVSMYSSFGYFENRDDDRKVLQNVFKSLKEGGAFILDTRGKEIHAMQYSETTSYEMPNGDLIIQRNSMKESWRVCDSRWVYVKDGKSWSYDLFLNLYSGEEIYGMLREAGFSKVDIFGNLDAAPYDDKAERLVAVGRKQS